MTDPSVNSARHEMLFFLLRAEFGMTLQLLQGEACSGGFIERDAGGK